MSDNKKKEYEDEQEESNQTPLITVIIILALIGFIYIYYKNKTTKPETKFIHEAPLTKSDFERMGVSMSVSQSLPTKEVHILNKIEGKKQSLPTSKDVHILQELLPSSHHPIDYTNLDNPSRTKNSFHSFQPASSNSASFHSMNYSDSDFFPVKEGSFIPSYD